MLKRWWLNAVLGGGSAGGNVAEWIQPTGLKTADYDINVRDLVLVDLATANANLAFKLPAAQTNRFCGVKIVGNANGWRARINKNAADRIDNALTFVDIDNDNESVFFESNGTDWFRLGHELPIEAIRPQVAPLRFSPVGLYAMNGKTDTADTSGNSNTLGFANVLNGVSPVAGKASCAFNGATSFGSRTSAGFNILTAVSGGALVNVTTPSGAKQCVFQGGSQTNGATLTSNVNYALFVNANRLRYEQESGARVVASYDSPTEGPQIQSSRWAHVGFTRDSAGTGVKLYIDGVNVGSTTLGAAPTGGTLDPGILIGVRQTGVNPFGGAMCGVWVCPSQLTDAQMLYMARLQLGNAR